MALGEMTHEKLHFIYRSAMEDEPTVLLELLKSKLGQSKTMFMIGMGASKFERERFKQALKGKRILTVYQEFRARYGYCAVKLIEEGLNNAGLLWFLAENHILERSPIDFLRRADPKDLFLVLRAAMATIGAVNGVYQ